MKVEVQRVSVAYETRGEGLPILLIHGWTDDRRYMQADLEPIFEAHPGWQRTYLDLPGHGATPAPDWLESQTQVIEVLKGFADAVMEGPFAIAGSSYGGYLTLGLVRAIPERLLGAALLVPDLPAADGSRDTTEQVTLVEDPSAFQDLAEDEEWIPGALVEQSARALEEIRTYEMPAIRASDSEFLERLESNYLHEGALAVPGPAFEAPSLILTGRQDSTVGYRPAYALLEEFPRATYAVMDLAGHWLGRVERPAPFRALFDDWLSRVEQSISGA